jgi:hypothetical protein
MSALPPKADIRQRKTNKSGLMHMNKNGRLFK